MQMKKGTSAETRHQHGFTLIELSIVLLIIGLIAGGVLTGQDLIKTAQVRAAVTQLDSYNAAVNTFHNKYNGLPGDLLGGVAAGFANVGGQGTASGLGNGDGLIEGTSTAAGVACSDCVDGEGVVFWYELAQAGYISDPITNVAANYTYNVVTLALVNGIIPVSKLAGQVSVNSNGGYNYYVLASYGTAAEAAGLPTTSGAFTPLQASQLDSKLDDGYPGTGSVISLAATPVPGVQGDPGAAAASWCSTGGTVSSIIQGTYNTTAGTGANCILSARVNF